MRQPIAGFGEQRGRCQISESGQTGRGKMGMVRIVEPGSDPWSKAPRAERPGGGGGHHAHCGQSGGVGAEVLPIALSPLLDVHRGFAVELDVAA